MTAARRAVSCRLETNDAWLRPQADVKGSKKRGGGSGKSRRKIRTERGQRRSSGKRTAEEMLTHNIRALPGGFVKAAEAESAVKKKSVRSRKARQNGERGESRARRRGTSPPTREKLLA